MLSVLWPLNRAHGIRGAVARVLHYRTAGYWAADGNRRGYRGQYAMVMEEPEYRNLMGDGRRCKLQREGKCVPQPDPPAGWPFIRRFVPWIMVGMLVVLVVLVLVTAVGGPVWR
jgi:hypothetical protein